MKVKKPSGSAPGLTLTPLLDMFTIILIFLIVSYDTENKEFKSSAAQLPHSTAKSIFKPAVNVAIEPNAIRVDPLLGAVKDREGHKHVWVDVVPLKEGKAPARYYEEGFVKELVEKLEDHFAERGLRHEEAVAKAKERGEEEPPFEEPILLIQAHKDIDYRTLYLVLKSAAKAGFFKYRLATLRG